MAFDYRVIALRRGYETKRLADVTNATPRSAIETLRPGRPLDPSPQTSGASRNSAPSGIPRPASGETDVLERYDVQVLLLGEPREWETVEYAATR